MDGWCKSVIKVKNHQAGECTFTFGHLSLIVDSCSIIKLENFPLLNHELYNYAQELNTDIIIRGYIGGSCRISAPPPQLSDLPPVIWDPSP